MQTEVRQIIDPVLEAIDRELGAGYSAVVYGSAARGEFLDGLSDLNVLLVCDALRSDTLRRLGAGLLALRHRGQPFPLLFERPEWDRVADVFPIEVADMQLAHEIVRGSDPVTGIRVQPEDLRRCLEQELRGKLLRLRQVFAVHAAEPSALGDVAVNTVSSIATLLRVALKLHGGVDSGDTPACLARAGATLGVDSQVVVELWARRRRPDQTCSPEVFERYLSAVATAVRVMDQFTPGGET